MYSANLRLGSQNLTQCSLYNEHCMGGGWGCVSNSGTLASNGQNTASSIQWRYLYADLTMHNLWSKHLIISLTTSPSPFQFPFTFPFHFPLYFPFPLSPSLSPSGFPFLFLFHFPFNCSFTNPLPLSAFHFPLPFHLHFPLSIHTSSFPSPRPLTLYPLLPSPSPYFLLLYLPPYPSPYHLLRSATVRFTPFSQSPFPHT